MKCIKPWRLIVAVMLFFGMASVVQSREVQAPQAIDGLGSIAFPTSTDSVEAQTAFNRGMLLLHLFEYDDAADAFQKAEALDPRFAMAYWGEAMTYNHGIWNQLDAKAGNVALAKLAATSAARAAKAPTPREKAYLAAVEILYAGQGTKVQRDARYSDAMQQLGKDYPHDNNAQLFYALSLMGRSEGVRDVPVYLHAGAIAERSFRVNPQNPGAAHYWIHAMDEPEHAAGALEAARALSKIAPDAGHAQHMTSHIFMALGMWDDLVDANENAMRVVLARDKARGKPQIECGHYQYWLAYGYYQQGRYRAGDAATQACQTSGEKALALFDTQANDNDAAATPKPKMTHAQYAQRLQSMLVDMRATSVIESGDWNGPAAKMKIETTGMRAQAAWNQFTDGYAAAQRGNLPTAQVALTALAETRHDTTPEAENLQQASYLAVLEDDLRGLVEIKQGKTDDGLRSIRQAADRYDAMAFDFGPPVPVRATA